MGYFAPALLAFIVTVTLICGLRPLAVHVGLTDKPGGRKRHSGEIPLVGGIAMFLAISIVVAVASQTVLELWYLFLAGAILLVVGAVDDRFGVRNSARIVAQGGAALVMALGGGLYLKDIGDPFGFGTIGLGAAAIPLTVVVTLTVINAYNFIDGIDGLAASMVVIALAAGTLASGAGAPTAELAIIACGAICGFLVFNLLRFQRGRLRTFMGDAGSTFLGFAVVWSTIAISQGEARALSPVPALWFALVPLADFFSCFIRRLAKGKMPFHAGRDHFHHILQRAGLSTRQVLVVLVSFAAFYASVGVASTYLHWPDWMMFGAWIALLSTQYLIIKRLAVLLRRRGWKASLSKSASVMVNGGDLVLEVASNDAVPQ